MTKIIQSLNVSHERVESFIIGYTNPITRSCTGNILLLYYFFLSQLFEIIYREEMLQSVINSVTRNILSIFLTANLAIILIYLFSIIGYAIFNDDFMVETHPKTLVSTQCKQRNNYAYMHVLQEWIHFSACIVHVHVHNALYLHVYCCVGIVQQNCLYNYVQLSTLSAVNIQQLKFYYHCFS